MKQRLIVRIQRDDAGNWLASVPAIKGAHTYGRSLTQLRRRLPELLRLWDQDPATVELVEELEMPANVRAAVELATRGRKELEEQSRRVLSDLQAAIARLQSQLGLGVRDSGELLGVSPQYVHKLRRSNPSPTSTTGRGARAIRPATRRNDSELTAVATKSGRRRRTRATSSGRRAN